jgi:hypothetical protein
MRNIILGAIFVVMLIIFGIVGYMFFSNYQKTANTLQGSGVKASTTRNISTVKFIDISVPGEVIIERSPENTVTIEADDNFINCFSVTDKDNKITLSTTATCNGQKSGSFASKSGIKFVVKTQYIERIALFSSAIVNAQTAETKLLVVNSAGSGTITVSADTDNLEVRVNSSGNIIVNGRADIQDIIVAGSGDFNGSSANGKVASAIIRSSGNIYANVTDALRITISGSGNVYYKQNPAVTRTVNGSGKVIKQ